MLNAELRDNRSFFEQYQLVPIEPECDIRLNPKIHIKYQKYIDGVLVDEGYADCDYFWMDYVVDYAGASQRGFKITKMFDYATFATEPDVGWWMADKFKNECFTDNDLARG